MQSSNQNWNAEDYAKNSSAQMQWAQELIGKLTVKASDSILDIGCGDGKITALLAQAAAKGRVLGIDSSENMIRLASGKFPPEENPNLSFLRMDAADIRLDWKFDIAFSNAVLHWIKDHCAILRGVRACLKPGGRVLFQMGGCGNAAEVFNIVEQLTKEKEWKIYYQGFVSPYHFYGPDNYKKWLPENGFKPKRIELIPKDMQYSTKTGFAGWLRTTWFPYTDRLPEKLREKFLAEVVERYAAKHKPDAYGKIHVAMVRLEIEAHTR